jgi:1,2-diacylglycerol 3-alpha-glucosyltransferase
MWRLWTIVQGRHWSPMRILADSESLSKDILSCSALLDNPANIDRIPEVFVVCSGLGHIHRGYETFTRQFFDALQNDGSCRLQLFKGTGSNSNREIRLTILRRTEFLTRLVGRMLRRNGYDVEQLTFAMSLIPYLRRSQPDVVYFSDRELGTLLWHWRRLSKQRFKLLFSNGGPAPPPFPRWDHIHQVSPEHYEAALRAGVEPERQTLIPYGCSVARLPRILSTDEKIALRKRLGLPEQRTIVISVGMISSTHKRMDYVVQEVHSLPEPRPFLLMLGQHVASESKQITAMAEKLLGPEQHRIASVSPDRIQDFYWSADVFVLASLAEGFGRVFLEAMAAGLPCVTHDHSTTRYVVGTSGYLRDLRKPGALAGAIAEAIKNDHQRARVARQRDVYERFSWERLASQYAAMLRRVAGASKIHEVVSH